MTPAPESTNAQVDRWTLSDFTCAAAWDDRQYDRLTRGFHRFTASPLTSRRLRLAIRG